MVKTIGNPLSWSVDAVGAAGSAMAEAAGRMGGREQAPPVVNTITTNDLVESLRLGLSDFTEMRTDAMFIVLVYPFIGAFLAWSAMNASMAQYLFPLASGFALVGPLAAVGLYEMSRRREAGEEVHWTDALTPLRSPSMGPILALGAYLLGIFMIWMITAGVILRLTMGDEAPASSAAFFHQVLTTPGGWALILIGIPIGACFAAVVLAISVVSFPLLVDRNIGLPRAVATSIELTRKNPATVATWGVIVAVLLALGSIPLFLGLIVVMPVLGHATWHLYRRAVAPAR